MIDRDGFSVGLPTNVEAGHHARTRRPPGQRDLEAEAAFYAEDAVLRVNRDTPPSGVFRGRADIVALLRSVPTMVDAMTASPRSVLGEKQQSWDKVLS
jgi:ketosteroid isomerase-like protein